VNPTVDEGATLNYFTSADHDLIVGDPAQAQVTTDWNGQGSDPSWHDIKKYEADLKASLDTSTNRGCTFRR
jgi:hypothetical protein